VRASPGKADAARASRLPHEAALIAEAKQELAEGEGITGVDLEHLLA